MNKIQFLLKITCMFLVPEKKCMLLLIFEFSDAQFAVPPWPEPEACVFPWGNTCPGVSKECSISSR